MTMVVADSSLKLRQRLDELEDVVRRRYATPYRVDVEHLSGGSADFGPAPKATLAPASPPIPIIGQSSSPSFFARIAAFFGAQR